MIINLFKSHPLFCAWFTAMLFSLIFGVLLGIVCLRLFYLIVKPLYAWWQTTRVYYWWDYIRLHNAYVTMRHKIPSNTYWLLWSWYKQAKEGRSKNPYSGKFMILVDQVRTWDADLNTAFAKYEAEAAIINS